MNCRPSRNRRQPLIDPMLDMVRQGGWVLIGIAAVSIIAWSLIFWEWLRLAERTRGGWESVERVVEQMQQSRPFDDQTVQDTGENFVGRLLRTEMIHRRFDRHAFEAQITPLLNHEAVMFEQSLRLVGVLAASLPLLGLLGTVLGMIQTFSVLTEYGVADVNALAGGISQALVTTQAGLVVSVPILLFNRFLGARVQRYLDTATVILKKIETAVCEEA